MASSDELAQAIFDGAPDALVVADASGRIRRANDQAVLLFGYAREELLGQPMDMLVPTGRQGAHSQLRGGYGAAPRIRPIGAGADLNVRRKDGTECPVDIMLSPVTLGGQSVVIVAMRDVRELRAAQRAVREREARLRAIFESEPECVKLLAADGTLLEMNAAGLRMLEADSLGQMVNQCVYPLVAEEDRPAFQGLIERVFEGESGSLAFRIVGLKGTRRWLDTHATPLRDEDGTVTALIGVTRDITESRRAQLHIAQINRTYAVMSDTNKLIVRERNPQAIFDGACRIAVERGGFLMAWVGLTQGHGEPLTIAAHAGATPDTVALLQDLVGTPNEGCAFTSRAILDGVHAVCNDVEHDPLSVVWRDAALQRGYRSMVSLPLTMAGRRVGVFNLYAAEAGFFDGGELHLLDELATDIGFALEVTERERERQHAEAALRASEERFRELAETIEDVFWVADPHARRILYVSPAYERIWGRPRAALYESPDRWLDGVHPDDRGRAWHGMNPTLAADTPGDEYRIVRPDGQVRWIRDRAFPVRTEAAGIVRVLGVARDLTERRPLEEQLRRSHTLEATGQLAAGVAHDFNNILTVILAGCEMAGAALDPMSPAILDVRQMADAAVRGATLTRQLLAFTRQQTITPVVLDLPSHLENVIGILRRTIPESIHLSVVTDANGWPVLMDPAQVDQIVLNLAVNARDAMPDGGTLTIEASDIAVDEAYCTGRLELVPGDYVRLTVRDDGHGMDADTKARVFEPFFTTKAEDRGTGLGLASVYGIVKQNRGFIEVTSDVDRGTTIATYLPRSQAERPSLPAIETRPARGDETVLLVEDNDQVRHVTRRLLENLGYRVLAASGPAAALDVSDTCEDTIDLLLTDVVMPEMDGMELAQRIRARRPGVRTLCMSGYAPDNVLNAGGAIMHAEQYLQKPFELRDLATAVRHALGTTAPPAGAPPPARPPAAAH